MIEDKLLGPLSMTLAVIPLWTVYLSHIKYLDALETLYTLSTLSVGVTWCYSAATKITLGK